MLLKWLTHGTLLNMQHCSQHIAPACLPPCFAASFTPSKHPVKLALQAFPRALTAQRKQSATRHTVFQRRRSSAVAAADSQPTGQRLSAASAPNGPSAAEGRKQMLQAVQVESFMVAGVSFEGRQELVYQLQADQAVMMVKEPDNAYDADAVAVQTLNGHCIGYVPREHTARFPHDVTFGHIYSFGPSSAGLWGVQVAVRPSVLPLTLEAFPVNLATHVNLSSSLSKEDWDAIRKATYRQAKYRCGVSGGVGLEWPVECHEVWRFHDGSQTLQLLGFQALHPEVHVAKHLERQQEDKRRQQAIWMLQSMNEWTVSEAEEYWKHARQAALDRSSKDWRFDLTWLPNNGFSIPAKLQQLCRN